jgi:hypothetical protein
MEINIRPVLPELHFVAAGINFPFITYSDLVEDLKTKNLGYDTDIYWIHNFTDIWEFLKNFWFKKISLKDYFLPYMEKKVFCVPFFDDPMPFVMMFTKVGMAFGRLFVKIVKKLLTRLLGKRN